MVIKIISHIEIMIHIKMIIHIKREKHMETGINQRKESINGKRREILLESA